MTDKRITTITGLESVLGVTPSAIALKIIDHVDSGAAKWLSACPLAFLGFSSDAGPIACAAGGEPGFIRSKESAIEIPRSLLDTHLDVAEGAGFGSLLLLPKAGEMLRINGRVSECGEESLTIRVDECYIHCAKALIRSNFWESFAKVDVTTDCDDTIDASRFLALVTMSDTGEVDVSPKGDPAGSLARVHGDEIWLADRPGNRRADSFKNMLCQPQVAGIFVQPGSAEVQVVLGTAAPTTDDFREQLQVHERVPAIATRIVVSNRRSMTSEALVHSKIWKREKTDIEPAKILAEHVKLNKHLGTKACILGAVTSIPGVMRRSLDSGYKKSLY